ncbi:MAG: peptidoglycan-binding domain-containing protein, partial [Christensenellales bacterium]|nr:peptidoglycan-binding domain-containing protein [Christensenellales bacterium]
IYDNCGKGTEVVIYEGEEDEELTRSLKIPPLDRSVMMPEPTAAPTQPPAYSADALPPMPFTTLERGVESEAVYWLQCKLTELGYYHGSITGGYYGGTVEACKAYQRDNGLSVDGKAGKLTLSRLYEDVLATPSPSPTPAPAATRAPDASPSPSAAPLPSGADPTPDAAPEKTSGMRLFVTVAPLP